MRSRSLYVALLFAVLAVGLPTTVSAQSDADVKALTQKVEDLEKRLATMERNLTTQLQRISQQLAQGGGGVNQAAETEAQTALAAVNRLISSGDTTKAKAEMTEFMKKHGSTKVAQGARRTYQELQVIGKAVPADWGISQWVQGEKDTNLFARFRATEARGELVGHCNVELVQHLKAQAPRPLLPEVAHPGLGLGLFDGLSGVLCIDGTTSPDHDLALGILAT